MIVIVAEKPSVASDIAKVVGATERKDGYLEGNGYCVTWCYGHLCTLWEPEDYDDAYATWSLETLPIIPERFQYKVMEDKVKQFNVVSGLMNSPECTEIIEATDAEREGELIFRTVQICAKCHHKNIKRLWINSLEEDAIREGLATMKDYRDFDNLFYAALCRQRADWIIGMNLTRYYTVAYNDMLSCGRVQTPVLNFIVQRDFEVETFKPKKYFIVTADMGNFKLSLNCDTRQETEIINRDCYHKQCKIVKIEEKESKKNAPRLYDLTTLQRECNVLFGYSASQTLDIAQTLYESKLTTYPRTDSRYITYSQLDSTTEILDGLIDNNFYGFPDSFSVSGLNMNVIVNEAKVSDHSAILPTKRVLTSDLSSLDQKLKNVLELICYRLLMSVMDPYEYLLINVEGDIGGHIFATTGRKDVREGYKRVERFYRQKVGKPEKEPAALPSLSIGSSYDVKNIETKEAQTKPPQRYTEAALLSAMENCGKTMDDDDLKSAMKDKGLGTPATRASIIEKLIKTGFVDRVKGKLISTGKGRIFISLVVTQLKDAALTAQWESGISDIRNAEKGEGRELSMLFLDNIIKFTNEYFQYVKSKPINNPDAFIREK